jgi:hypothetical protein
MRERKEKLIGEITITVDEVMLITGMDDEAAEREISHIIQYLGTGSEDLSVKQFCRFNQMDYREVVAFLNRIRPDEDEEEFDPNENPDDAIIKIEDDGSINGDKQHTAWDVPVLCEGFSWGFQGIEQDSFWLEGEGLGANFACE